MSARHRPHVVVPNRKTPAFDRDDIGDARPRVNESFRRDAAVSRRVCNLELNLDHTLYEKFLSSTNDTLQTREHLAAVAAAHVNRANKIFGAVNFGGIEDISFMMAIELRQTSLRLTVRFITTPDVQWRGKYNHVLLR